jgi:internalin A
MFERYTERARRIIFFARYEASQFGSAVIEPEHLLLGFFREDKAAWRMLAGDNVRRVEMELRDALSEPLNRKKSTQKLGDYPLANSSKRVLTYAAEEADRFKSKVIDSVHLFIAVLRERKGLLAIEPLTRSGIYYESASALLFGAEGPILDLLRKGGSQLDLSNRGIGQIPETVFALEDLEMLDLSGNQLTEIPEAIGNLSQLRTLDLSNNRLTALPLALTNLAKLSRLKLAGNPGLEIPPELLGDRETTELEVHSLLSFFFRTRESHVPLNECKIILVGRGGVGKTSLVNRLVRQQFDPKERPTEGIGITSWFVRPGRGDLVKLHVWDFGGQEIMHATHQFFLTERSLYLLVLSGRENSADADAEYWLKLISSLGGDSPVVIALNKIDEYPFDLNRVALLRKHPRVHAFVQTDCESDSGLARLKLVIEAEIAKLEFVRAPFPSNWMRIKWRITNSKSNFLSYAEYSELCREFGEADPREQEQLAQILHNLGIALNYRDDPRLQETHVLNPYWVTNGIYAILNAGIVRAQNGEIFINQLDDVLNPEDYPMGMRRFLFDLMKKFELCFSFPDDDCHYLIPEILGIQEPQDLGLKDKGDSLKFEYRYEILPEGVMPRFIVRSQVLSDGLPRWRSGVVLRLDRNEALVRSDLEEKRIVIDVYGDREGRRSLLAVIRSDLERIHSSFKGLTVQQMVPVPGDDALRIPYDDLTVWEAEGRESYALRVGQSVVDLPVKSLLSGVDLAPGNDNMSAGTPPPARPLKVFYSYSHKDDAMRGRLQVHLKILERQGLIESWSDREIEAGEDWKVSIAEALERAELILLLVSADFISSDYCYCVEMKRALEKHAKGESVVIPVIVKDVNWKNAPFSALKALPKDGKAISTWAKRETAWKQVSEGIERALRKLATPAL